MSVDGQSQSDSAVSSWRSFVRSSIVWKLTLFVGILVALNDGVLIGVAYFTTSAILRDQIHQRLLDGRRRSAGDAGKRLGTRGGAGDTSSPNGLESTSSSLNVPMGRSTPERFRAETEPILSTARNNTTGFLALWIEDNTGQVLAASGPESLVEAYSV